MSKHVTLHGLVAPGFEPVREAFRANFQRGEIGAHVCVMKDGEVVVDLRAGQAHLDRPAPWQHDTLAAVFSATKGIVALAFLMVHDRGLVDLDAPVATWWPEFGANGKEEITLRQCLNHRAGLHALHTPLTIPEAADPETADAALIDQIPLWVPGVRQGYGATIWGVVLGAMFRRLTGQSVGTFIRDEIAEPLGLDMHLGLSPSQDHRVATLYPKKITQLFRKFGPRMVRGRTTEGRLYRDIILNRSSHAHRAFLNPDPGPERLACLNDPSLRHLELPWMNLHTTASALARVYAALANGGQLDGVRLVSEAAIEPLKSIQSWSNMDAVLRKPMGFSQGFQKEETTLFSPDGASFGHSGVGGALGFADPNRNISFGYVLNAPSPYIRSPRCLALCHALYRSLGVLD